MSSFRHVERHSRSVLLPRTEVNLDFDARVPIPFSLFPSSYRRGAVETTTETHIEGEINLPQSQQRVGREDTSSYSSSATLPPPDNNRYLEERIHITREHDHDHHRHRRPSSRTESIHIRDERRSVPSSSRHPPFICFFHALLESHVFSGWPPCGSASQPWLHGQG